MKTHKLNNHEISLLFSLRTRTVSEIKGNFPSQHKDNKCPLCGQSEDTQEHCLSCDQLNSNKNLMNVYSDIYSSDLNKQILITKAFLVILEERRQLIEDNNKLSAHQLTSGQWPVDPDYTIPCNYLG